MIRGLCLLLILAALAGCGSGDKRASGADSPAVSDSPVSERPSSAPAPTPSPTPTGAKVEIVCEWKKGDALNEPGTYSFDSLREAWAIKSDYCTDSEATGTPSARETLALETAYPKHPRVDSLGVLYGMCAENDPKWLDYLRKAGSPAQLREVQAALILCPKHPQRQKVAGLLADSAANNELVEQGRVFYDGTYRVGKNVPAGTYFAKPSGDGCYWERTDAAGNIIDNNFSNGLRVVVTVQASDYALTVRGCGEWRPVS